MATAAEPKIDAAKAEVVATKVEAKVAPAKAAPAAAKAPRKAAAPKKTAKPAAKQATRTTTARKLKDTIMTKTQAASEEFTAKLKTAFEKGNAFAGEYGEFAKGNVEALVESGKILAAGLKELGSDYVAEGKSAFETMTADVKDLAAVKSPADFFKLQGEIVRRNFDAAVTLGSKRSEAMVKLANEAFAPIQGRVAQAMEKVKQAA